MARKAKPKIADGARRLIESMRAKLKTMPEDAERQAWAAFVEAQEKEAEAEAALDALGDSPKNMEEFSRRVAEVHNRNRIVFTQYDRWHALTKHKVTVPADEMTQIILDALQANREALMIPNESGLSGYHQLRALAKEIHAEILSADVKVREETQDVPYCSACEEELAA